MNNETLRDVLGEAVMFATRGFKNRTEFPIEWNKDDSDSQFAMVLEDVDIVIARLEELGLLNNSNNIYVQSPSTATSAMTGVVYPPTISFTTSSTKTASTSAPTTPTAGLKKTATFVLELSAGSTLEELEEYVETLKSLDVSPDDVVVPTSMRYVINLLNCGVEKIDCGECGYGDYVVFPSEHVCDVD